MATSNHLPRLRAKPKVGERLKVLAGTKPHACNSGGSAINT